LQRCDAVTRHAIGDPKAFTFPEGGCGGGDPGQLPSYAQETRIGRYEP